jgi:lambda family phage portal protein
MRMNLIDRAIGWFSPATAARRGIQRAYLDKMTRGYEGASVGRRSGAWRGGGTSADAQIEASLQALRDRMRVLVRDNPHAAKAVSVLTTHVIGDGIMPRANTGSEELDRRINKLFLAWTKNCDADGQLDFAGIQTLAFRGMVEGGETLVRRRTRARDKARVPLQLQVLEGDHIDSDKDGPIPSGRGAVKVQGVEFNTLGTRVAYWLFPQHPGNKWGINSLSSVRVPAADICHLYEKQRTQTRGVPWGSPVIAKLRDLADYSDAELMRKKTEACIVGVVVNGDEDDLGIGLKVPAKPGEAVQPGVYDGTGAMVERFEPGMFAYARGGKDIKFNTPAQTADFPAYKRSELHDIAAGFRVPYELMTSDLSQVSFISGRLGLIEFQKLVSQVQWQIVIPMLLEPVWQWWVDAAYLAGLIPTDQVEAEWGVPRMGSLDPLAEAKADLLDLRMGKKTFAELCAERGRDEDVVLDELAASNKKLDARKILLDSDPRAMTAQGMAQQIATEPTPPSR